MEGFKVLLAMCFLMSTSSVQGISNSGNEFNLMFPPNLAAASAEFPPILCVTTDEDGPVQFTVSYSKSRPPVSDMSTHTARKKNLTRIELPFQLITSFTAFCTDCGITLKAEEGKNIIVYALNEGGASTDVYLGLPYFETKTETYDYYGVSVPRSSLEPKTTYGYMAMVVQEAGTVITLTPTVQIEGFLSGAGLRFQPTKSYSSSPLAKGFTVLLRATEDLTGSKISSNKPITFITGHQCGFLPSNVTACDHLTEQLPPAETFGFKFVLVPLLLREQDGYRIVASRDGTTVNLNCVDMSGSSVLGDLFSLDEGQFRQLFIHSDRFCTLEASLPIVVVQIALGHSFDEVNPADPFMVMIPPLGQYRNDYSLIFAESFSINSRDEPVVFKPRISLSVPSECCNRGQIEFDNGTIPWNIFVDVKCENGEICACAAQYEVPSAQSRGGHSLQHSISECTVGVIVYAYEKENSYGYPGGMNVDSITDEDGPVQFTVSYTKFNPSLSGTSAHTAKKKNLTRIELPYQLVASFSGISLNNGQINLKAEEGKTIIVYALNEGDASTDVYLGLPYFKTKTETYNYYGISVPRSDLEPMTTYIVYAYEKENSYGYPGGMNVDSITGVVVQFDPISYEIVENSGAVNISLVANAPLSQDYMVVINTTDGTATGVRYESIEAVMMAPDSGQS